MQAYKGKPTVFVQMGGSTDGKRASDASQLYLVSRRFTWESFHALVRALATWRPTENAVLDMDMDSDMQVMSTNGKGRLVNRNMFESLVTRRLSGHPCLRRFVNRKYDWSYTQGTAVVKQERVCDMYNLLCKTPKLRFVIIDTRPFAVHLLQHILDHFDEFAAARTGKPSLHMEDANESDVVLPFDMTCRLWTLSDPTLWSCFPTDCRYTIEQLAALAMLVRNSVYDKKSFRWDQIAVELSDLASYHRPTLDADDLSGWNEASQALLDAVQNRS
jgi:hypothetical protein